MAKKKSTKAEQTTLENQDNQEKVSLSIDDIIQNASENMNNIKINTERKPRWHRRTHVKISVGEILKRINSGKFIYPKFQRDYVWKKSQLKDLLWSMRNNYSAGALIISECEGKQYITDGLQRTMSFLHISRDSSILIKKNKLTNEDKRYFEEESKKVLDYEILVETVHDMTRDEMPEYFILINNGTTLKASIKERSRLDPELREVAIGLSSMDFFKTVDKYQTFNTQAQSTIISYCALLAAAEEPVGEIKSRSLCTRIIGNKESIIENKDKAADLINRLSEIYKHVHTERTKKSMNAAFVGVLMFVLAQNPKYSDADIARMINYIWESPVMATKEYRETTLSGSGDIGQCKARYDLIVKCLKNKPKFTMEDQGLKAFDNKFKDRSVVDSSGKYEIDYNSIDENVKRELYVADLDNDQKTIDKIVKRESGAK